jgi:hypothetical protein
MLKQKRKYHLTLQASVRGVVKRFPIQDDGVRQNAEMNLRNTQNKRGKIVKIAKIESLEPWQMKIFAKNAKKGWRFFQPDSIDKPTPRSAKEAWGGTYHKDDFVKKEDRNQKILVAIVFISLIILSVI